VSEYGACPSTTSHAAQRATLLPSQFEKWKVVSGNEILERELSDKQIIQRVQVVMAGIISPLQK
jgi:hypothetical protein